ncbi:Exocyst complex component SEC3 [Cyphellophora attinorum]|uniref:Exocyst complex component SEC3 n=1 Tax=Cyphellophora attinorum TaxID=1664694 RepID=A0A0N1H2T5_9EURO|nr:Exocyst complex component SEC3 [Phialophora attinorum]KPI34834.1 Exocyst complex component SEC3 [Phialophora attinorum]
MSYGGMNQQRGGIPNSGRGFQQAGPDTRNGSLGSLPGHTSDSALSNQDRAARFEDEKKRIIESCFAKRDPDGTNLESYITHVRVAEDAMYPSSPAPANSPAANKKNRIILVAVRRSGKVRVHKARENPNGSFSIGKTWNLDELSAIQSYTAFNPSTNQESMEKQWAGTTGFLVTLGKPYYWQASTAKEKDFFIASLTKIFRKYTGGRAPQLIGFAPQEMDMLTASTPGNTPAMGGVSPNLNAGGLPSPVPTPPSMPAAMSPRPQSPLALRAPARPNQQPDPPQNRPYNRTNVRPETREGQRMPSEEPTRSPARFPAKIESTEDLRKRSLGDKSASSGTWGSLSDMPQPLRPSASPKPSVSSTQPSESISELPANRQNGVPKNAMAQYGPGGRNFSFSKSQESVAAASDYSNPSRPSTAAERKPTEPVPPVPPINDPPPDRLRPQIGSNREAARSEKSLQSPSASQFVTPAASPGATRNESRNDEPEPLKLSKGITTQAKQSTEPKEYFDTKAASDTKGNDAVMQGPPDLPAEHILSESPLTPVGDNVVASPDSVKAPESELSTKKEKEEEYRPGLGPMMKKKSAKDIANQFRKAALAASAFQPRQGGAGARLKAMQDKNSNEPDGITSVVPAPLLRGMSTDSVASDKPSITSPPPEKDKDRPRTPLASAFLPKVQLQRTATDNSVKAPTETPRPVDEPQELTKLEPSEPVRSGSPERKKRQKLEIEVGKYCAILGVDPRVMEGRGADFNEILTEFGWEGRLSEKQKIENFESAIRRENGRAQAAGWLGHIEQQEVKVADLSRAFDKAIAECEEMDGLLTLYSHELDTLAEDIEYIEAQSQGLQVQTANQKLLQSELQGLLKTLTISSSDLRALQSAPLDSADGVQSIEMSLLTLYRALLTIDPEIRQNKTRKAASTCNERSGVGVYADQEIGQMRAVTQKKEEYREETLQFLRRFNQHMTAMFKQTEQRTSEDNSRSLASVSSSSLLLPSLQSSRQELWSYSPIMLFVREVNSYEWSTLISRYEINIKNAYVDNFREYISHNKKKASKPAGEELEALFTHQEKDKGEESMTSTAARKLTVKRGKTVKAGGLRRTFDRRDGKPDAWEIFDSVLQEQAKVVAEEQNFIVHFFHLTSQTSVDWLDNLGSKTSAQRSLPNLSTQLPYDADRDMAKQVQNTVEGIYSFWTPELEQLTDWAVGVLCALERTLATYEETNQEYMTRALRGLHDRLAGLFQKFIDEQVKAIEETKVKVSKRKGIIPFMRTFPIFSSIVEGMIPQEFYHNESLELRFILNDAYSRILKAMWESLSFIAKDNPASGTSTGVASTTAPAAGSGDPEDKEALNYHILLIENMNHYLEEVQVHDNMILRDWRDRAEKDMYKHLSQYVDAVIRRPMGKWLDFLESTEALLKTNEGNPTVIANKPSHSRSSAKKVLSSYDAKEVRKGVETLKKSADSRKGLISRVLEECNIRYDHAWDRMDVIVRQVYEGNLEIEWKKAEVGALFKR